MRFGFTCLAPFLVCTTTVATAQDNLMTLEQAAGRGTKELPVVRLTPRMANWRWAPDGKHLVRGRGDEERWVDPVTWKESTPPADAENEAGRDADDSIKQERTRDFAALEGVDAKLAKRLASGRGQTSDDGEAVLVQNEGELWFHRKGAGARRLHAQPGLELLDLAPDGHHAAYVRDNDLHVVDTRTGRSRAITTSGDTEHHNGKLDWVYQEEVYGRGNFKAVWWSPDSAHIAFLYLDESAVHEFTVVDHIEKDTFRVKPEVTNYPKVGDPNPSVRLGIADAESGSIAWADMDAYAGGEPLIVRVTWTPDSSRCLYVVQDRIQTWADLNAADPATGASITWIHEQSKSWTERPPAPRWLADGTFLWRSHRTGYDHLYRYRPGGELVGAVTAGEWSLRRIQAIDEDAGRIWFSGTGGGAVNANIYSIGLGGEGLMRLTKGDGQHSVRFNADRTLFLDRVSSLAHPGEVRLGNAHGDIEKVLARAEVPALDEYRTSAWELHEVETPDGFSLDVALLKPVPFDPEQSYPVWLPTYSGPDAPSVRNRWNSSAWLQFLAQNGVIVMQVNVRSASGKGHWAIEQCYKQLGVSELQDLVSTVDWLTSHPWADAERVGITGYSYGGFMSAFALCASDRFALGVAGGGVYDWAMYDTIYTERYMSTPERNPEGYEKTSCLARAKDLNGHLYMHHGVMDDNVHVQNIMQMAYALQKAGKDFEMMVYPQSRHGIRDRDQSWHAKRKEWSLIQEHLGAGRTAAAPPAAAASGL
ncbi:MAG: prolyl oligopeptidase family serine peptidase [bacterium]|nr:prolyl oligopeptidase family serine peptidase [bacterium]